MTADDSSRFAGASGSALPRRGDILGIDVSITDYAEVVRCVIDPLTVEEQAHDAREIMQSGAAIVFVGMGCPRQEWWLFHMRKRIPVPMLAVGAAFDFHAGLVMQAPGWMQARGLEWAFRLSREPTRLWRRYVLLTPRYIPLIAAQALGHRFLHPTDLAEAERRPCPG